MLFSMQCQYSPYAFSIRNFMIDVVTNSAQATTTHYALNFSVFAVPFFRMQMCVYKIPESLHNRIYKVGTVKKDTHVLSNFE